MSTAIQRRRGSTAQHSTFTGLNGETTVDTDKRTVVVHDGVTAGGFPLARQNLSNVPNGTIGSALLADGAVTTAKVADGAVTTAKLADGAVPYAKLGSNVTPILTGRNKIINGKMDIDQRNAGASITLTASTSGFPVDRMRVVNQTDGTFTAQRSTTTPAGFTNSVLLTVTATDTSIGAAQYAQFEQRVEGFNVADLGWGTANAQSVTLSFWVRSSLTGTFCAAIYNSNGSRCYVATYTINAANTFEYKTITIAGDTSGTWQTGSSTGIDLIFALAVGSNSQQAAGSWGTTSFAIGTSGQTNFLGTNGATFYITGVQLEVGSVATPFEHRPFGAELALCQRYYWRLSGTTSQFIALGNCELTTRCAPLFRLPLSMRATPTIGTSTITSFFVRGASSNVAVTSGTAFVGTNEIFGIEVNTGSAHGGLVGGAANLVSPASAWHVDASSEL